MLLHSKKACTLSVQAFFVAFRFCNGGALRCEVYHAFKIEHLIVETFTINADGKHLIPTMFTINAFGKHCIAASLISLLMVNIAQ